MAAQGIDSTTSLIAPDIAAQQVMLGRRQQMADLLRQQSMTPDQGQMIGSQYIAPSWSQGLAKMAQALMASKSQDSIDAQSLDLAKSYGDRIGAMFGGGATDASTEAPAALAQGAVQGDVGPTNSNAERMGAMLAQGSGAAPQGGGLTIKGMSPGQAKMSFMLDKGAYMGGYMKQFDPTEQTKMALAAGMDPRQANAAALFKNSYIAPVNARPGSILRDPRTNMPMAYNPHIPEGAAPTFDASGNVVGMNPIAGASYAITAAEKAKAMGGAAATPTVAYGPTGTPQFSTKAKDVGRADGNPPAGAGVVANDPQAGSREIAAIQKSLDTPGAVTDTSSRQMLQQQITELKRQASAYPQPTQGTVTPELPPGLVANANAAQGASAKTMHDSYAKLQSGGSTAQAALDAVDKMQKLAANKNWAQVGKVATGTTFMSPDAAEYEKQRANLITQLSQQNGTGGTDAGRALTGESVPDFGKPKAAIADGLQTLKNQTVAQQLKINFLTPHYQAGDSKTYTALENKFDQNISPSMVPLLTAQPGPARAAQLQAAAKDPAMRAKLNWAAENGLLK